MGWISESMWVDTAILLATILVLLYYWSTSTYNHWQKLGVKTPAKVTPFLGSITDALLMKRQAALFFSDMYCDHEGEKFVGYYKLRSPAILLRDPELIKQIVVKDFSHFQDNDIHLSADNDPLFAYNIFSMKGDKWKYTRSKVGPAFTNGKVRNMFPLILEITQELKKHLQKKIDDQNAEFEAKNLAGNFTTDVVGSCAFAFKCDSLNDEFNEFRSMGRVLLEPTFLQGLTFMAITFAPKIANVLGLKFVSDHVTNYFRSLVRQVFEHREKSGVVRNDFIQLLMQLKKMGSLEEDAHELTRNGGTKDVGVEKSVGVKGKIEFTHDVLTAQAFGFFADGFETSSITLSFAMHELAMNPDIQSKLRAHLRDLLEERGGQLSFDVIRESGYLEQVVFETLRKYPPAGVLSKTCTQRYQLPGSKVTLEVGTTVNIPVHALHNDPQYYPSPEIFDPERFSEENKKNITPYTFLPFGEGPRQCIGMRFGLAQVKAALATIVLNFDLQPSSKTEHPVQFHEQYFLLAAKNGLHLQVAPLPEDD